MKSARLNIFQKTQRFWDTIHPYNAAQLAELSSPRSIDAIDAAFKQAIADLRLGDVVCRNHRYTIESSTAPACIISDEPIDALLTRLMNLPFDPHRSMPFRPFVNQHDGRQTMGLVYQHWVADSVSIRLLMRQWIRRLNGEGASDPIALPRGGMWHYFSGPAADWSVVAQLSDLLGYAARMKRMRRIESRPTNHDVAVIVRTLPDGIINFVRRNARDIGATVGDVFIAAATEAVAMHGPNVATPRRPGVAMGTIVDPRARSRSVPANVFGLFLGFTMTSYEGTDAIDFDHLLRRATQQRRRDTRRHAAEASQLNMAIGYAIAKCKSRASLLEFYRKRFPLSGGLSSVNLGPEWTKDLHPESISLYHRVSPTGPLMPIVLTPTTLGDRLSLCVTYRTAVMSAAKADAVIQAFVDRLVAFAKLPPSPGMAGRGLG